MARSESLPDHRVSQAVKIETGKSSAQWNTILDRWDWKRKGPDLAAQHLRQRYGISNWWARSIILRYRMQRQVRQ